MINEQIHNLLNKKSPGIFTLKIEYDQHLIVRTFKNTAIYYNPEEDANAAAFMIRQLGGIPGLFIDYRNDKWSIVDYRTPESWGKTIFIEDSLSLALCKALLITNDIPLVDIA